MSPAGTSTSTSEPTTNSPGWIGVLLIYMLLAVVILIPLLVALWPLVESASGETPETEAQEVGLLWGQLKVQLDPSATLFVLAAVAGALGAFLHAVVSLADYVGNRRFLASWTVWYVVRLPVGATLAILFYFVVRAGFISVETGAEDVNPYGVVALGGLAGLFAKQATDKLREVFETLFRVAPGKGDDERADSLTNPKPTVTELRPSQVRSSTKDLELRVVGRDFTDESLVRLGKAPLPTEFRRSGQLSARVEAAHLAKPGQLRITVMTPEPGGGTSEPLILEVLGPPEKKRRNPFRRRRS